MPPNNITSASNVPSPRGIFWNIHFIFKSHDSKEQIYRKIGQKEQQALNSLIGNDIKIPIRNSKATKADNLNSSLQEKKW